MKMELKDLTTKFLGRNFVYLEQVDSTQLEILRKIEKNKIENGSLVLADIQTNGQRNTWKTVVYRRKTKYSIFILYRCT